MAVRVLLSTLIGLLIKNNYILASGYKFSLLLPQHLTDYSSTGSMSSSLKQPQ
jgi:hypothetical protein